MGAVGAAAVGAVGTMGATMLSGNKGGGQTSSQSSAPWGPQQQYDLYGLGQAQNVYQQNQNTGPYTGEFVAGENPTQAGAVSQATGWTNGTGGTLPGQTAGTASTLQGAAPNYVSNAEGIAGSGIAGPNAGLYGTLQGYGTGANTTAGANPTLSSALNSAAVAGANGLQNFQNQLTTAGQQALSDPTQRIENDAASYASNPTVAQNIAAVNQQIGQTLNENTLPQLNREASMGGSLNSSRAGMAEGMANEGAAIAEGSADANIMNNAYNTGLGTASNLYSSGLNSAVTGGMFGYNDLANNANSNAGLQQGLNEFNTSTALNAANSGLSNNLSYELGNANTQLAANNQLGTATGLGIDGSTAAGAQAANNFNIASGAGALQQAGQQANDTNALSQWQMNTQYPWQNLDSYWQIAASPLGGTSSGSAQSTLPPNYAGAALGGAAAGLGLYQNYGGGSYDPTGASYSNGYDPYAAGYNGSASSSGGQTLQSLGLYTPLPQ